MSTVTTFTPSEMLEDLTAYLAENVAGLAEDQIVDYYPDASKATSIPLFFIVPEKDWPTSAMPTKTRRHFVFIVGVLMKVPGIGGDFKILDAAMGPFITGMEEYTKTAVRLIAGTMQETDAGLEYISLAKNKDRFVAAVCGWQIVYDRKLGA